jgi:hypothetical protein
MSIAPSGPFQALCASLKQQWRHPYLALGIVALGTLLAALSPLLQIRLGLPDELITESALGFAAMIPLELYFMPRFLARLDAEIANRPENPADHWQERFEERYLKAFGTRMLLLLAVGIGLALFIVPGLVILLAFGWAPLRVLLRGESLANALRSSLALMAKTWRHVLSTALVLLGGYLLLVMGLGWCVLRLVPDPSPWQRLTHPAIWGGRFLSGLLELTLSLSFFTLYSAVEPALDEPKEPA